MGRARGKTDQEERDFRDREESLEWHKRDPNDYISQDEFIQEQLEEREMKSKKMGARFMKSGKEKDEATVKEFKALQKKHFGDAMKAEEPLEHMAQKRGKFKVAK